MRKLILYTLLTLPLGQLAIADQNGTAGEQSGGLNSVKKTFAKVMLNNESFVEKATINNLAEVELARLALSKSKDAKIQEFAQQMIKDHTEATQKLSSLAKAKNIVVPTELDEAHKEVADKLSKLDGAEFDKEFSQQMKKDHDKAVTLFSAATDDKSLDPEFKQFAEKLLPTLKQHQHSAHNLKHEQPASR